MYFANITIQSKDDKSDFRAFVHCKDALGRWWELRAYGNSAATAAENGWLRYLDYENWSVYGYVVEEKRDE